MIIYKYCGAKATPLLHEEQIKVTRPIDFNDPYEFMPRIVGDLKIDDLIENDALHRQILKALGSNLSLDAVRALLRKAAPKQLIDPQLKTLRELAQKSCDLVSKDFGVLCFSRRKDSVTMWSHYGDLHRGFVVGIDEEKFRGVRLLPVKYGAQRVRVEATWDLSDPNWNNRSEDIFLTKHRRWRHEREVRAIIPLISLEPPTTLLNGESWFFHPLPQDCITSIALGVRCSEETRARISEITKRWSVRPRIETAVLREDNYGMDFEQITL